MPEPWAIYCRISRARDGSTLGVDRQEPPTRQLIERLGGHVAGVYVDNDISAFSGRVRPDFERMLTDLREGRIVGVAAWQADRLVRRVREAIPLLDTVQAVGGKLATVTGEYDLSSAAGRWNFRNLANMAEFESDLRGERLRLKHDQLAEAGAWHGGKVPFGYRLVHVDRQSRIEPDPITGPLVQEAVSRILAGESVGTIIAGWNAQGITAPEGGRWHATPLRKIVLNPVIAALRVHRDQVIGEAAWEPLITRAQHEQLKALFGDKAKRRRHGRGRTYLLSGGLCRCGSCGVELYSARRNGGIAVYACRTDAGGCGGVQIRADDLERLITDAVVDALSGPALTRLLAEREDETTDRLAQLLHEDEEQLKAYASLHGQGRITTAEWLAARDPVEQRITETRAKLQRIPAGQVLVDLPRTERELREAWEERSVDWRRALVSLVLDHVTIHSAKRVGRALEGRVDPTWKV
jgi:DNA invertase Pin-like site-specific DNA recombinase